MDKKTAVIIGLLIVAMMGAVRAYPALDSGNLYVCYDFGTGSTCMVWFNSTGFLNAPTLNATDLHLGGSVVCADCIGDEDVSNTLTASDLVATSEVVSEAEVADDLFIDQGEINLSSTIISGKLGYDNITPCADTQILKISGSNWACAADATGAGGVDAYVNETGDLMTGHLNMTQGADIYLAPASEIRSNTTGSYINITETGALVFYISS